MIQGFSGGLLNRELIYQTDLPSFQRDFASLKTLDHGTGPNITFTRASNATYFDADGVLQTASNNVPRFDHDSANGNSLGLLIEEARTNSIRNSQAGGAGAGTLSTNWTATPTTNNVTRTIVGGGTEGGMSYLEIKYAGTPTATASVTIGFDTTTQVVAANGQTWSGSLYCRLVDGSLSNATVALLTSGRDVSGNSVAGQATNTTITPTSSALITQRFSSVVAFSNASVERVMVFLTISYTNGDPIDLTLRIAAPQLEQGAFATSYIPTTSAAATRAADSAVVTPISSFYNQAEGTLFAEWVSGVSAASRAIVDLNNSSITERLGITTTASSIPSAIGRNAGSIFDITIGTAISSGAITKMAVGLATDNYQAARDGSLGTADTSGAMPSIAVLRFGNNSSGTVTLNGHLRKVAYWPRRLSNTLLQQLTT